MSREEIGEVKGGDLTPVQKLRGAVEKCIAMGAVDHSDAEAVACGLQQPAGAAITIGNQDGAKVVFMFENSCFHGVWNVLRRVVQLGWQAGERDVIQPVDLDEGQNFARQRTAGDHKRFACRLCRARRRPQSRKAPREQGLVCYVGCVAHAARSATSRLAVSTAIAASSQ